MGRVRLANRCAATGPAPGGVRVVVGALRMVDEHGSGPDAAHETTLGLGSDIVFVAAAVCPHPPLLVPEVAVGAARDLDDLRTACFAALGELLDARLDRLLVVGAGADLHLAVDRDVAGGSLRRFGVETHVGDPGDDSLPLSLTIGAWLLEHARTAGRRLERHWPRVEYVGLGDETPLTECAARSARTVAGRDRVGVLAMADLSAKRTESSPGYVDPRALGFDEAVAEALCTADVRELLDLDANLARELWCSGVPALAALAGAAQTADRPISARAHSVVAPYGVGYAVVSWRASQADSQE